MTTSKRTFRSILFCVLLLALVASACAPAKQASAGTIKVGVIYPLTGNIASTGAQGKQGVELAVDIINNKHDFDFPFAKTEGIPALNNMKIEPIFADSRGEPDAGLAEAERLITSENVIALIGSYQSSVVKTASQAAERLERPFLNADGVSPALAERGFKWYFGTGPTAYQSYPAFAFLEDLAKAKNLDLHEATIGAIFENTDFGTDTLNATKAQAAEHGYEIDVIVQYPHEATDLSTEVLALKSGGVDILLQGSYTSDAILFTRTMKDLDFNPEGIVTTGGGYSDPTWLKNVGADGNYIILGDVWTLDLAKVRPVVGVINSMYKEKYGADMDSVSARSFTAMMVLADALQRAGSTDNEKLREALMATNIPAKDTIMVWDGIKFDEKGRNVLAKGLFKQILDAKYTVVWPFEAAVAEIVWPMPPWDKR